MPELPEVETTLRGVYPALIEQTISQVIVRQNKLRWPVTPEIKTELPNQIIRDISRRAKYLLFHTDSGTLIIHLGMSGRLHLLSNPPPAGKHDHIDLIMKTGLCLRYTDPRRFGAILWTLNKGPELESHPLLTKLGPEPLGSAFTGGYLFKRAHMKKISIKQFIMDGSVVVGVGNIYAAESLFCAGLNPERPAGAINQAEMRSLVQCIKHILKKAIKAGGTTLKDFYSADGNPGYFEVELQVYGKEDKPCPKCQTKLKRLVIGQRSTVYCPRCQK